MNSTSIVIVLLLAVMIVVMFRGRRKRQREQAELQTKMVPGVEVMLTFGLHGTLVSVDEAENIALVEIAPGTIVKVHRQTLGRVVDPAESSTDTAVAAAAPEATPTSADASRDDAPAAGEPAFGERIDTKTGGDAEADPRDS